MFLLYLLKGQYMIYILSEQSLKSFIIYQYENMGILLRGVVWKNPYNTLYVLNEIYGYNYSPALAKAKTMTVRAKFLTLNKLVSFVVQFSKYYEKSNKHHGKSGKNK